MTSPRSIVCAAQLSRATGLYLALQIGIDSRPLPHQIGGSRHGQYARHWSASHAEFRGWSSTTLRAFLVVAERLARRAPELGSKPWVWRTDTGARLDPSDCLRHASLLHRCGDIRLSVGGSSDACGFLEVVRVFSP